MFKHIAIPTDGSKLADKGVRAGVKLAQCLGARVTGVYVVRPYRPAVYGEIGVFYVPGMSPADYKQLSLKAAKKALAAVEIEARSAGVACETRIVTADQPYAGILRAARAAKCDAIAMASHGRSAVGGLLLGSETARVLSHSRLPVLVTR